jgi:hypothetical protein
MGYWGSQPRDNDDSGDAYHAVIDAFTGALEKSVMGVVRRRNGASPFSAQFNPAKLDTADLWNRLGILQRALDDLCVPSAFDPEALGSELHDVLEAGIAMCDEILDNRLERDDDLMGSWRSKKTYDAAVRNLQSLRKTLEDRLR